MMNKETKKARIIETLKREEVKPSLEYSTNTDELYAICSVFLEDIDQEEFEALLIELMEEPNPTLNKDLQDVAAGVKVGSLYFNV